MYNMYNMYIYNISMYNIYIYIYIYMYKDVCMYITVER